MLRLSCAGFGAHGAVANLKCEQELRSPINMRRKGSAVFEESLLEPKLQSACAHFVSA